MTMVMPRRAHGHNEVMMMYVSLKNGYQLIWGKLYAFSQVHTMPMYSKAPLMVMYHILGIMYIGLSLILGTCHLSLIVKMACLGKCSRFTYKHIKQLKFSDLTFFTQSLGHLSIV
jgi:hypothetical protein